MTHKTGHTVPEGYFEELQMKLSRIPQAAAAVTPWGKVRPYLALAAAFAALVVSGTAILRNTVHSGAGLSDEDMLGYIQLIPATDPYLLYEEEWGESYSDEDIVEFLIETGVSLEQLAYAQED